MFDNLVAIEPEDVEAYLRTAKVVISLCDHKVAIGEDPDRVNGGACRWMKHQFPDAGRAIRDLQIVLRVAGTDVGKRTESSRFQALQKVVTLSILCAGVNWAARAAPQVIES